MHSNLFELNVLEGGVERMNAPHDLLLYLLDGSRDLECYFRLFQSNVLECATNPRFVRTEIFLLL